MAGNQERIDDVISPEALKQVDDLSAKLDLLEKQFADTARQAIALNNATGNSRSFRDYNTNATKAATETAKLQQAQANAARSAVLLQQAQQRLATQTANAAAAQQRSTQTVQRALSPYQQLVQIHKDLIAEARDAAIQFGRNSTQYIQAANQANGVGQRLNTINNSLGNFSNNVGNYGNAITNALGKAFSGIRTLAYILPGLGIAGIFDILIKGATLLFNKLTEGKFTLDEFAKTASALNKAFEDNSFKTAISNVIDLKEQIKLAKEGFIDQEIAVDKYNETIGKTIGQTNSLDVAEKNLNAHAQDYIKMMFYKAAAAAALAEGTDDLVKATKAVMTAQANSALTNTDIEQLQKTIKTSRDKDEVEQAKYLLRIGMNAKKNDDESLKEAESYRDKLVNQTTSIYDKLTTLSQGFKLSFGFGADADEANILKRRYDNAADVQINALKKIQSANDDFAENEQKSYKSRVTAANLSANAQIQIAKIQQQKELQDKTLQKDQIEKIESDTSLTIFDIRQSLQKKLTDLLNGELTNIKEKYSAQIESAKAKEQEITSNQDLSIGKRAKAIETYQKTALNALQNEYDNEVKLAGDNKEKLAKIDENYAKQQSAILKQVNTDSYKLRQEATKEIQAVVKDLQDKSEQIVQESLDKQLQDIEENKAKEILLLSQEYQKGEINQKQYNDRIRQLNNNSALERIQDELDAAQTIYGIRAGLSGASQLSGLGFGPSDKDVNSAKNKVSQLQIALSGQKANNIKSDTDSALADKSKELQDLQRDFELFNSAEKSAIDLVNQGYERQLQLLEAKKNIIDENSQREIDAINRSFDSEKTKQDKIAIINAKAAAQKDQITQRENAIKRKQAELDKIAAVTGIIENTALAVVKSLPNIPLAVIVGALGAAQLAVALSQPIPAYEKGTKSAKGGLSLVGEAGAEYVIQPDGKSYFTPDTHTIMDIPKGSQVISNAELMRMTANPNKTLQIAQEGLNMSKMIDATNKSRKEIVGAIKGQKQGSGRVNGWENELKKRETHNIRRNIHFK